MGIVPKCFVAASNVRFLPNSSSRARNRVYRCAARITIGGSSSETWFGTRITGPDSGTCSRPTTSRSVSSRAATATGGCRRRVEISPPERRVTPDSRRHRTQPTVLASNSASSCAIGRQNPDILGTTWVTGHPGHKRGSQMQSPVAGLLAGVRSCREPARRCASPHADLRASKRSV